MTETTVHASRWRSWAPWLVVALCTAIVAGCVLHFQPHWGLMDDHNNVVYLERYRGSGVWAFVADWVPQDLRFGMLRPLYPVQVWVLWGLAGASAPILFLLNIPLVLVALVLVSWALVAVASPPRADGDGVSGLRSAHIGLVVLAALSTFWFHDLFWYPSLQEKQVYLAVAICVAVIERGQRRAWPDTLWFPVVTATLAGGFLTKGQFAYFLPVLVLAQAAHDGSRSTPGTRWRSSYRRTGLIVVAGLAGALILKGIAAQGIYTGSFTWVRGLEQLRSPIGVGVALLAGISLVDVAWRWRRAPAAGARPRLTDLGPGLTLLAFLVVMAPRGLGGYVIGGLAPVLGWTVLHLVAARPRWLTTALVVSILCAPTVTSYRNVKAFARSDDLRRIIHAPLLHRRLASGDVLQVPCQEGTQALRTYLTRLTGGSPSVIWTRQRSDRRPAADGHTLWFGDRHNCPLAPALTTEELGARRQLVAPNFPGGFELSEVPAVGTPAITGP